MRRLLKKVKQALFFPFLMPIYVLIAASPGVPAESQSYRARVVGVTDGDTVTVMRFGRAETLRLADIDAPDRGQPFSEKAKHYVSELAYGKEVLVVTEGAKDKYGRTVGEAILADKRNLGQELVKAGLAWWCERCSNNFTLKALQAEARRKKRGLWADKDAVAAADSACCR